MWLDLMTELFFIRALVLPNEIRMLSLDRSQFLLELLRRHVHRLLAFGSVGLLFGLLRFIFIIRPVGISRHVEEIVRVGLRVHAGLQLVEHTVPRFRVLMLNECQDGHRVAYLLRHLHPESLVGTAQL